MSEFIKILEFEPENPEPGRRVPHPFEKPVETDFSKIEKEDIYLDHKQLADLQLRGNVVHSLTDGSLRKRKVNILDSWGIHRKLKKSKESFRGMSDLAIQVSMLQLNDLRTSLGVHLYLSENELRKCGVPRRDRRKLKTEDLLDPLAIERKFPKIAGLVAQIATNYINKELKKNGLR